jgi:hypothetical protein
MDLKKNFYILHEGFCNKRQMIVKELTVSRAFKEPFKKKTRLAINTLTRDEENPIVENGEIYLTYEIVPLILTRLLKGENYSAHVNNPHNIFVLNSEDQLFQCVLRALSYKNGFIRVLYFIECHAVSLLLSKVDEDINIFYFDPVPDNELSKIETLVLKIAPRASLLRNSTQLQFDYSSCTVFSLRAMLIFYSGNLFLNYVEKIKKDNAPLNGNLYSLRTIDLPKAIRALNQNKNELCIENNLVLNKELYNPLALLMKYYLINVLDNILKAFEMTSGIMKNGKATLPIIAKEPLNWFANLTPERASFNFLLYKLNLMNCTDCGTLTKEHSLYVSTLLLFFKAQALAIVGTFLEMNCNGNRCIPKSFPMGQGGYLLVREAQNLLLFYYYDRKKGAAGAHAKRYTVPTTISNLINTPTFFLKKHVINKSIIQNKLQKMLETKTCFSSNSEEFNQFRLSGL